MIVCRVLESLFVLQIKMIFAGIGVGCFLIFLPAFLIHKSQNEEQSGLILGSGLGIGLVLSILL
ncbi:MAG: hypothetical protein ACFFBD_18840, partial [Candidatus Hodarchaeota archaeon]